MMRSDVHHDDRLLTLFRLRRGLLRLRGLRFRRRLRLWSGGRLLNRLLHMLNGLLRMLNGLLRMRNGLRLYRLLRRHGALRLLDRGLGVNGLMLRRLRCTDRLFRAHRWLLRLTLIRRLILVLRLTRCFMLPMNAIRRMTGPMNPDFTNAFNIVIKVVAFRRFIVARLHTFQWAIAKHRGAFFTAGPETVHQ
ncbi:hypothetical protein NUBL21980_35110 [Klebsiella michiganensis]|nr:hypothetical protein NUBL21980_35110 [Klebsiella michiganensis]